MTTQDTIELIYRGFQENPIRLTYSTKNLCKQFNTTNKEIQKAKALYKADPNDYLVAQSKMLVPGIVDYITTEELFKTLTGEDPYMTNAGKPSFDIYANEEQWEVKQKWVKGPEGSQLMVKKEISLERIKEDIIGDIKKYAPKYKPVKREYSQEGHLLVLSLADIHLGKLSVSSETGEEYNVEIAYNRVIDGVKGILNKIQGFHIDSIVLIIGNDILHTDTLNRTTTAKTPQDTDGMWHENFIRAKDLYVEVIEMLNPLAKLWVHFNPSNHDTMSGFFLAQTIEAWFRNTDIDFNVDMSPRKYVQYGLNLIGTTHGGEAKEQDLPLLMAQECSKEWGESKFRYWYLHHIHHKKSKDYGSVCVEYLRSPSATDAWHSKMGFQYQQQALEGFIHNAEQGQIARITHNF